MVRHEVAYPDRAHFPVVVQLLQRTVGAEGLVELARQGLVQEQQVDLVDAELASALVERVQRLVESVVADPDLRLDEDLVPGETGLADRVADAALVRIRSRGVDQPVPGRKGRGDGFFRLGRRGLEDAEAEDRHHDAVVQSEIHGADGIDARPAGNR